MITFGGVGSRTGLSPAPAARSSGVPLSTPRRARGQLPPPSRSFNPETAAPVSSFAAPVWAPPRSLAATRGILSSPRGTQMFHFPRFPPGFPGDGPCAHRVAPFGSPGISGCQRLPQAFRRVAASFLGRHRQGIHPAPVFRTSHNVPVPTLHAPDQVPFHQIRHQTGSRQRQDEPPAARARSRRPQWPVAWLRVRSSLDRTRASLFC